jgi:DNA replication and repair protein RecF
MKTSEEEDLKLRRLRLRNFRNYQDLSVSFGPALNSIYGANAQGKSNLLEALFLFVTGRSFRSRQLSELIAHGEEAFFLDLHFDRAGMQQRLCMEMDAQGRRISHQRSVLPSLRELLGLIPGVLMGPDDIALIKGAPAGRRQFLDMQLAQVDGLYLQQLMRYQRALKQRNTLLRRHQLAAMDIWEEQLAESGAYILQERHRLVADLGQLCSQAHEELCGESLDFSLHYKGLSGDKAELLQLLQSSRQRELQSGNTAHGPHRDDWQIHLDGREARSFASEGQQRSCVTALCFAEWRRLRERSRILPILCMDDLGLSLDPGRRQRLLDVLLDCGQVFVTTPELLEGGDVHPLHIHAGQLRGAAA